MVTATRLVSVGRIAGPYGVRGWLKVVSFTDPADNLFGYQPWRLRNPRSGEVSEVQLSEHRAHGKIWVVQLAGVDDRDAAAELSGQEIVIERAQLPAPGQRSYYWADLEGMAVETQFGEQLGYVDQLLETGSADVMVIVGAVDGPDDAGARKRTLVPFLLDEVVLDVDLEAQRIQVNWDLAEDG